MLNDRNKIKHTIIFGKKKSFILCKINIKLDVTKQIFKALTYYQNVLFITYYWLLGDPKFSVFMLVIVNF